MTPLEKLTFYMKPYYQDSGDQATLQAFLDDNGGSAYCAAAELWALKAAEIGVESDGGVTELKNGAESTKWGDASKAKENAEKNAKYFEDKCKGESNTNSGGFLRVQQQSIGGVPPDLEV